MNFKKSLAVLSIASILSMGIVNCGGGGGDLTVLKSGTYDCMQNKTKVTYIFDLSKHTWDYIFNGSRWTDDFTSLGVELVIGERDESRKSYKLFVKSPEGVDQVGVLNVNGTKFSMYDVETDDTYTYSCIKR
jgi:hypothetical protein